MKLQNFEIVGLHNQFAKTEAGQKLKNNIRYQRYKPADWDNRKWEKLLGADVNNLEHNRLTFGLVRVFLKHLNDQLTERETKILLTAALIHDYPEHDKGDVTWGDKTNEDEEHEHHVLEQIMAQHFQDQDPKLKQEICDTIKHKHPKLGPIFDAIETIGYIRTALRANQICTEKDLNPAERQQLEWLIYDVMSNQTPRILDHSAHYAPVRLYLICNRQRISKVLRTLKPETSLMYPEEKQAMMAQRAEKALPDWQNRGFHFPN